MEDTTREKLSEQTVTKEGLAEDCVLKPHEEHGSQALEACQSELEEMKNRYLYLTAECENLKKRVTKDRVLWVDHAQDKVLLDLLLVVDDLDRALAELDTEMVPSEMRSHFDGFSLIAKSFKKMLSTYGVEEIPPTKVFNPEFFEAVMQQESADHESGDIIAILQKGYRRNGRVLRPAKVSVAQ